LSFFNHFLTSFDPREIEGCLVYSIQSCLRLVNISESQRAYHTSVKFPMAQSYHPPSYGESHCRSVGCIVDGCPPGMALTEADIQPQMTRRRPGQSALTTPRDEKDRVEIQSGTEFGVTLGTPIAMIVTNEDQRPKDYGGSTMDKYPRPSHADFTYLEKYGVKASSGGGRSSARETIGANRFLCLWYLSLSRVPNSPLARTSCCWGNSREVPLSCAQRVDSRIRFFSRP
jgi:hypothetical protein